ncbi:type II toxin-antitoxin system HigB family toxin [Rugamonas rubra]|jgi:mRNA interferase HigB|nr:type II toxin-antitoxin system HigB family toxin [Rugamonas rubra]
MRVISNKALVDFSIAHPPAHAPMQAWRKILESRPFANFADIKRVFNATDKAGDNYIFNIGGNKYRIVAGISFQYQRLYIRYVFTHEEYNKWKP